MSHSIVMNSELFYRLYAISTLRDSPFWQQTFEPTSNDSCFSVVFHCEDEFETQLGYDNMQRIATALIEDLFELKQEADEGVIYDFLQFSISTHVANFVGNNKVGGLAYNWLANSIDDVVTAEPVRNPDGGRIYYFILSNHPFIENYLLTYLNMWCHTLFYYSRISGGHLPVASGFLNAYGVYYLSIPARKITTDYIRALCDILAWCVINNEQARAAFLETRLQQLYDIPELPPEWKKIITFQFSCMAGTTAGQTQEHWSNLILTTYREQLRGFETLQALLNYSHGNSERILEHLDDFYGGIQIYRDSLGLSEEQSSYMSYELSRSFEVLMPILLTLIKEGNGNAAAQLFIRFFNTQPAMANTDGVLHIVPNDIDGVVYCLSQEPAIIHEGDTKQSYINAMQLLNIFLQHTIFLNGLPEYVPPPPPGERNGTPREEHAGDYLAALINHFRFDRVNEILQMENARSYYLYNGYNLPLQPVMLREIGFVVPMCYSFQQVEESRQIQTVLLWQDDTLFSSVECDGIVHILTRANIQVVRLNAYEHTLDDFKREYESNDYDYVHISAHGEHRHYEPHQSYIQLGAAIQLHNEQLTAFQNSWDLRRLLVLNICDGATTSLFNSPVSMGVSNHLIHSKQSVLSHLWPVNPRIAVLYGFLAATCIVRKLTYSEIYREIVSILLNGKEAIIEYLQPFVDDADILQTVENIDIDLTNFTYWGSLAYFE